MKFSYEKLDVYKVAIRFFAWCAAIISRAPTGPSTVIDQLKRASLSIVANIAEATGKTTKPDKKKFYAIARGSAMECGAILDAFVILKICSEAESEKAKTELVRVVSMLTKLCR